MIPSTNGNSAPKGCNPVSSNCVIWQGPDLPCIDLCTGDSISAVLAKLCEQLVAIQTIDGNTAGIDISALSPGCLQDAYPDMTFESLEDYINALVSYVCTLEGEGFIITPPKAKTPIVKVPDCFANSVKVTNGKKIIKSITNIAIASTHNVIEPFVLATESQIEIYTQYLNGEIDDPGFTLNTTMEKVDFMVLNTTNSSLYTVSSDAGANNNVAPFHGEYSGWGDLMGKATCELINCTQQCLTTSNLITGGGEMQPPDDPKETPTKPLSKANKLVIDRMIKNQVQKSTTSLPKVVSKYVLPDKKAVAVNVLLTALEKEFGILRNMSGTVSDMRNAIMKEPMNLSNESVLNGNTKMGLLPGWYKTPNNLSQSVANAWMTIADMRNAVSDIQKNFFGNTTCQDITYDVKGSLATTQTGVVTGIKLDFSGTKVRLPFKDCGAQGCKVTVEDTDFNSITKYVNVVSESQAKGGTNISFQGSNINTASNYKVTVDMCFTDGDSQCAKSVQFNVENNQSCPTITFPKATKDSITFKLTGVNGGAYDLTLVCEGQGGGEFGRRVYDAPKNIINGQFTGLPAGKTFNIYAELRSKGSGVVTKCPSVSTTTVTPACVTSNVLSSEFKTKASLLSGKSLNIACYNDSSVTYSTKAGFDIDGNFIVVKCSDCNQTNCDKGEPITSYGSFISDTSSTSLVIKSRLFASTVGAGKEDSGWKYVGTLVNPFNTTIYVYALVNKDNNSIDQVVGSCDCSLNFTNAKPMNYCVDSGSVLCKVNVIGFESEFSQNQVKITGNPYKGTVQYDTGLSTKNTLVFTYNNNSPNDWTSDSFKFTVNTSCGISSEMIVPITRAERQYSTSDDIYVYVNTTTMTYTDAVDLKATFEAIKLKMQSTCINWTGSIYYIPVDSTTDSGDYLNYPKSLIDMKAGASGSISVSSGTWSSWKSIPSYWSSGSKESPPTSATIIAFTNTTSTNAGYGFTNLSDGLIGQPTPDYQTQYEELQDLLTGTEVTAWGTTNNTSLKYFGNAGIRFSQILIPIIDSTTGESAASALQMLAAIYGRKLKLAESDGLKVGAGKYPVSISKYLYENSSEADAPYDTVTSNNITLTGLSSSNFSIGTWIDTGVTLGTANISLQANLMAILGIDPNLFGTNCSIITECSKRMTDGSIVLWGFSAVNHGTACTVANTASNCMEIYHPSTTVPFTGISYKSAAGACAADASDEIETGYYALHDGSGGKKWDQYTKTVGWSGVAGTGSGTC